MRRASRRLAPLVLALLPIALAAGPSAAAPSEADSAYRAWRIPEHRWWSSSGSVGGSVSHRDAGRTDGWHDRFGSLRGSLVLGSNWGFDSDPSYLAWSLRTELRGDRLHREFRVLDATSNQFQDAAEENLDERFTASGEWRRYPWALPVALSVAMTHDYSLAQRFNSWNSTSSFGSTLQTNTTSSARGFWSYQGVLSVGTGLGRVRDATPVYRAQVLEDRLRRTGALGRALSHEARQRLAALLAAQGAVGFAHQRPSKYFWEALEGVLRDDGALERGTLDAYSAHRILEPVVHTGSFFRRIGWFVGPAVVLATYRNRLSDEYSSSTRYFVDGSPVGSIEFRSEDEETDRRDEIRTAFVAEAHRPLGLRWQLDGSHSTQIGESGEFVTTNTVVSATWAVTDRWFGGLSARHSAIATGWGSARRIGSWDVSIGAELGYFLEDTWALSVRMNEFQLHTSQSFNRSGDYLFGITRVFSGYFELPGITAMRAAPPVR